MFYGGQFCKDKRTGETGQLEVWPLYDRNGRDGPVDDQTGILWIPKWGSADHWVYVKAEDLEPAKERR